MRAGSLPVVPALSSLEPKTSPLSPLIPVLDQKEMVSHWNLTSSQ